jgi:hypothetical protein
MSSILDEPPELPSWSYCLDPTVKAAVLEVQCRRFERDDNARDIMHPLARLLELCGDPHASKQEAMIAARYAEAILPYFARKVPEVPTIEREPVFDFGRLDSARDILRAQKRVMRALGAGSIGSALAARHIGMLDALRRSHADVVTEERLLNFEQHQSVEGQAFDSAPDSALPNIPEPEGAQ